jgi:hypothetical protein
LISRLFRPLPHPSVPLFAIILGVFGIIIFRKASTLDFAPMRNAISVIAATLVASALYLVISFVRGVRLDLALKREGLTTDARITQIEERSGGKGYPDEWWLIHYSFRDAGGRTHEGKVEELDEEKVKKFKVDDTVRIRYHPDEPSIGRWLE